jgi:hypothetical protein
MNKDFAFPACAEQMLKSYREHIAELINTTNFLDPSHGYRRLTHFAQLDDLLSYIYYIENGRWLDDVPYFVDVPARPDVLGPFSLPSVIEDILKSK